MARLLNHNTTQVTDPPFARMLFGDRRLAFLWLPIRLYVGWMWFDAATHKIFEPKWVQTGESLKGYWLNAVKMEPKPVAYFDWYRGFLQYLLDNGAYTWFARMIAYGELFIGIALMLGAFTGIAAFFGAFMNWNFIMAGTASSNPLLFVLAIGLILAWKVAGHLGADRFLLPLLGTPWEPAIKVAVLEREAVPARS